MTSNLLKIVFRIILLVLVPFFAFSQENILLLEDKKVQYETNQAINDLYNFKFEKAEQQFRWIRQEHPEHPLSYFLMGMSAWWKIVPNIDNTAYDEEMDKNLDICIEKAEKLLKNKSTAIEGHFFLAGCYGFKGRLYSERHHWRKASFAGKAALEHLQSCEGYESLSPELLFGRGLYNYFREWIPENYKFIKPVLLLFPKGNKEKGITQLIEVTRNAFYTRTESRYYLMQIYGYEGKSPEAYQLAKELYEEYPDNAFFERYYARMNYVQGKLELAEKISLSILEKVKNQQAGYEATSARYAAFYLGYIYKLRNKDSTALHYFTLAKNFAEEVKATDAGYYHLTLAYLAEYADKANDKQKAIALYEQVLELTEKKNRLHQEAKAYLDKNKPKSKFLGIF
jgi:tetratricopeptide (TPR) repeat protein